MRNLLHKLLLAAAIAIAAVRALKSTHARSPKRAVEPHHPIGPFRRSSIKRWAIEVAAILAITGVLGFLVAASGIIPIKASSGHWPITRWFLTFSMARSVSMHAYDIETPPLDDPALVLRGAGHYETGCRSCHGSPSLHYPKIAAEMAPDPPYLPDELPHWKPRELFYIVKHGVKLTGMPAWPARYRDDEVWAVVAFLLRMNELDAAAYDSLVFGESPESESAPMELLTEPDEIPSEVLQTCSRCHGIDGTGRGNAAFPSLAGQKPQYLYSALRAFATGRRHSGIMQPIAAGLGEETMRELARYYGSLTPRRASPSADPASIARGREIALRGVQAKKIPSCADCHGPSSRETRPAYPRLSGQYARYLTLQLELFAAERRGGSPYAHLMHDVAPLLTKQQRHDVSNYYESLWSAVQSEAEHRFE